MRSIIFLYVIVASISAHSVSQNVHQLPTSAIFVARSVVESFMRREASYRDVYDLKRLRIQGLSAAVIVLDLLEPYLDDPSRAAQRRIQRTLSFLPVILRDTALKAEQKEYLRTRLTPFLNRYQALGRSQKFIVEVYQNHNLWTVNEFWFLNLKANHLVNSYDFFWPMVRVGRAVSDTEKRVLNESLNRVRPYAIAPLMVQYKLGTLEMHQYDHLLRFLEKLMSPMSVSDYDVNLRYTKIKLDYFMESRRTAVGILQDMQKRLNDRDPWLTAALERVKKSSSARPAAQIFYEMFERNSFRDMVKIFPRLWSASERDPLGIEETLQLKRTPVVVGHPAVQAREANVLFASFGAAKACRVVHAP